MNDIDIPKYIGNKIKFYRKKKNYTLESFSKKIFKSKSTLSKYENSEITIDIRTLYDISEALKIPVSYFLYDNQKKIFENSLEKKNSEKISETTELLYYYFYDARKKNPRLVECVIEIEKESRKCTVFWLVENPKNYKEANYIFSGEIIAQGNLNRIICFNRINNMDLIIINFFRNLTTDFGNISGSITSFSLGQFESYSTKCILSNYPLKKNNELIEKLKISKEAIKDLKKTNVYRLKKL